MKIGTGKNYGIPVWHTQNVMYLSTINDPIYLFVSDYLSIVKPSKPRCWMEGKLLEGGDVKMSCKSTDGSDPIHYKWERVLDKGKYIGKLPPLALIGKSTLILLEYMCLPVSYTNISTERLNLKVKIQCKQDTTAKK